MPERDHVIVGIRVERRDFHRLGTGLQERADTALRAEEGVDSFYKSISIRTIPVHKTLLIDVPEICFGAGRRYRYYRSLVRRIGHGEYESIGLRRTRKGESLLGHGRGRMVGIISERHHAVLRSGGHSGIILITRALVEEVGEAAVAGINVLQLHHKHGIIHLVDIGSQHDIEEICLIRIGRGHADAGCRAGGFFHFQVQRQIAGHHIILLPDGIRSDREIPVQVLRCR